MTPGRHDNPVRVPHLTEAELLVGHCQALQLMLEGLQVKVNACTHGATTTPQAHVKAGRNTGWQPMQACRLLTAPVSSNEKLADWIPAVWIPVAVPAAGSVSVLLTPVPPRPQLPAGVLDCVDGEVHLVGIGAGGVVQQALHAAHRDTTTRLRTLL